MAGACIHSQILHFRTFCSATFAELCAPKEVGSRCSAHAKGHSWSAGGTVGFGRQGRVCSRAVCHQLFKPVHILQIIKSLSLKSRHFEVKQFTNGYLRVRIWRLERRCSGSAQKKKHASRGPRESQGAEFPNVILTRDGESLESLGARGGERSQISNFQEYRKMGQNTEVSLWR